MSKLQKIFLIVLVQLGLAVPLLVAAPAGAVEIFNHACNSAASSSTVCTDATNADGSKPDATNPIITDIKVAIQIIAYIIGVASVIIIIVSGFQFLTAGGDPQAVKRARDSLIYAIVGIAIAALAQIIVAFILDNVG